MAIKKQNKWILGTLLFVILSGAFYISMGDNVKIKVTSDKVSFYTNSGGSWLLSGEESIKLYNSSGKLIKPSKKEVNYTISGNDVNIVRTTYYSSYDPWASIREQYQFSGNNNDVKLFPVYHKIDVMNLGGTVMLYEAKNLVYDGNNRFASNPESFGNNMKITWNEKPYLAQLKGTKGKGTLSLFYNVENNFQEFNIRMYDPPSNFSKLGNISVGVDIYSVYNDSQYIYVGTWGSGLFVFRFNGSVFQQLEQLNTDSSYRYINQIRGYNSSVILVATSNGQLRAMSFNGDVFTIIANTTLPDDSTHDMWVYNNTIFVSQEQFFTIYNLSNDKFNIMKNISYAAPRARAVYGYNNSVFYMNSGATIYHNLWNGTDLNLVEIYNTWSTTGDQWLTGDLWANRTNLFVTVTISNATKRELHVFSYNSTNMTNINNITVDSRSGYRVWGDGDYIYVSGGSSERFLIVEFNGTGLNVSKNVSSDINSTTRDVYGYSSGAIYTASGAAGLIAFGNPTEPPVPPAPTVVTVSPGFIGVQPFGNYTESLWIIEYSMNGTQTDIGVYNASCGNVTGNLYNVTTLKQTPIAMSFSSEIGSRGAIEKKRFGMSKFPQRFYNDTFRIYFSLENDTVQNVSMQLNVNISQIMNYTGLNYSWINTSTYRVYRISRNGEFFYGNNTCIEQPIIVG